MIDIKFSSLKDLKIFSLKYEGHTIWVSRRLAERFNMKEDQEIPDHLYKVVWEMSFREPNEIVTYLDNGFHTDPNRQHGTN